MLTNAVRTASKLGVGSLPVSEISAPPSLASCYHFEPLVLKHGGPLISICLELAAREGIAPSNMIRSPQPTLFKRDITETVWDGAQGPEVTL